MRASSISAPTWLAMHIRVKSDDSPSEMSIIAVASRFVANHFPNSILASGRRCLLRSGLPDRPPAFRSCLAILSPSSASPSLPLTKIRSPGLAPFRRAALPLLTSPSTLILISTRSFRVVSPPAIGHLSLLAAFNSPSRKPFSQVPTQLAGRAKLKRKHLGSPPIAATSLAARTRHFHPTASAGCQSLQKCVPSRNQSVVKTVSNPFFGLQMAASSPMLTSTPDFLAGRPLVRAARAISRTMDSSLVVLLPSIFACSSPYLASQVYAASTCPFVQWTGIHSLSQIRPFRGLTQHSSELNMDTGREPRLTVQIARNAWPSSGCGSTGVVREVLYKFNRGQRAISRIRDRNQGLRGHP